MSGWPPLGERPHDHLGPLCEEAREVSEAGREPCTDESSGRPRDEKPPAAQRELAHCSKQKKKDIIEAKKNGKKLEDIITVIRSRLEKQDH